MKKKKTTAATANKVETINDLKNEPHEKDAVKKGYNEKNPTQPQGAFKPDAIEKKN